MQNEEVRKGLTQAKESESGATWLFGEIFIIAIITGIYFSSWWLFGGIFLGMILLMFYRPIRLMLFIILSIGSGIVGWLIGQWIGNIGASVVIAIIAFLVSCGSHIYANKWLNDV